MWLYSPSCVIFVVQDVAMVSEQWSTSVKDVGDTEEPVRCLVTLHFWGPSVFLVWRCVSLIPTDNLLNIHNIISRTS